MKILIADDDPTLRMLLKEILEESFKCTVIEAGDGEEAWHLLQSGADPDLCIFDMRMPGLGGTELVLRLRSHERLQNQRVLVCSGVNERNSIVEAVSAGIDGYLLKPFQGEYLRNAIRKVLNKPQLPPPSPALRPLEEVIQQLGTRRETYIRLLNSFTLDVSSVIQQLRGEWTPETRDHSLIRLGAIRSSGTTLGADTLVQRADSLEQSVAKNEVSAKAPKLNALELENQRVIVATGRLSAEAERVLFSTEKVEAAPAFAPKPAVVELETPPEAEVHEVIPVHVTSSLNFDISNRDLVARGSTEKERPAEPALPEPDKSDKQPDVDTGWADSLEMMDQRSDE